MASTLSRAHCCRQRGAVRKGQEGDGEMGVKAERDPATTTETSEEIGMTFPKVAR